MLTLIWSFSGALALASIAGYLGAYFPWMDGFSHLRMQYGIAGGALALLATLFKAPRLLFLTIVLMVVNFYTVAQNISFNSIIDTKHNFKIMSINLWAKNSKINEVIDFIRRQNADVLLLQETVPPWLEALKALKVIYPHQISQKNCQGMRYCEVMLLSKRPWSNAKAFLMDETGASLIWARFPKTGLTIATTHLNRPFWTKGISQVLQIDALAKQIQSIQKPLLIAGDFNATPWSAAYRRLTYQTNLRRIGQGLNVTWPSSLWPIAGIPIDHMLVKGLTDGIIVNTTEVPGSDHLALIANLKHPTF